MRCIFLSRFFLILLFFLPQISLAAADITRVLGTSVFTDSTTTPEIIGGMGGTDCSGDVTNTETCNSCQEDTLAVCNTARVYPSLQLRIEFVDADTAGKTLVIETSQSEKLDLVDSVSTENQTLSAGSTHVAVFDWTTLCQKFSTGNDPTCTTSFSRTLRIGVSENGTDFKGTALDVTLKLINPSTALDTLGVCEDVNRGICQFTTYPGDKKIYLEDVRSEGNFPSDSNSKFKSFRIIYSTESFAKESLNPREAIDNNQYKDIQILEGNSNTEPDLANNTVDDLSNNTLYFFRGMLIDEANNLTDITDDSVYTGNTDCGSDLSVPAEEFLCPLTARPDEVIGLLAEDFNCFISTVAFGSSMAPKVQDFRSFRRKFLLPYSWGRRANLFYYEYGSRASQIVKQSDFLKNLARWGLYPIWLVAKLCLEIGIVLTLIFSSLLILVLLALGMWGKKYFSSKNMKIVTNRKSSI